MIESLERPVRSCGRRLAGQSPRLERRVLALWSVYIRLYARVGNQLLGRGADPFTVVRVDPAEIEHMVEFSALPQQAREESVFPDAKFKYAGSVRGGDWDRSTRSFEESELYRSFEAHFRDGVPWEETPFFETVVGLIEGGTSMWGCETSREFERRCDRLDALYERIDEHGYLSQRALMATDLEDPIAEGEDLPYHVRLVNDELTVCVGRDGEFLFKDGRDRLAIAKLLDLSEIPVWVMLRHARWQDLREAVSRNPSLRAHLRPEIRSHPDLPRG